MRFAIWQHAGKGAYLTHKLLARGHTKAESIDETDLLLLDCDWRWAHPRPQMIGWAKDAGAKVALFPHGGHPTVFIYDGLTDPDPQIDLRLEHGQGSIDVANQLGLDLNQQAPGWLFSPTKPFRRVKKPRKLLFAPQHPNMETINVPNPDDPGPKLNQRVYKQLLQLGYEVTVTYVGPAWKNGVWFHPGVRMVENPSMRFDHTFDLIQQADVVVGAGSVAACAVASGVPTVMFGQGNYADFIDGKYVTPNNVDVYGETLKYPIDCDNGEVGDLIVRACAGDSGAAEWRKRFIGKDGTEKAADLLEDLVATSSPQVIIGGVTATAKLNL